LFKKLKKIFFKGWLRISS